MPPEKGTVGQRPSTVEMISGEHPQERPNPPKGGSCVGRDTDLWYPIGQNEKRHVTNGSVAMQVCHQCPVQLECLVYGLGWERFGIWGGTSEHGRKLIRAKMRIDLADRLPG